MTLAGTPKNVLFILSDEHNRDCSSCYGSTLAKTPHIDALAARGARFDNAYTNCPICVPARASLATGRYVQQTGCWDNAHPYHGQTPSWSHRVREAGLRAVSIGKLHYRSQADDNGFSEEILPMHVVGGVGDLLGLLRETPAPRPGTADLARDIGAGETGYTNYDRQIADAACAWLEGDARKSPDPFALFVSFVLPHFPLIAPEEFHALYDAAQMPLPKLYGADDRPKHPVIQAMRKTTNYDDYFTPERAREALAAYLAMVSYLDHNIGRVLGALEAAGLAEDTLVIYTSDHGDNLGARGLWGKSVMYEESAAVPLILAGPGVAEGSVCKTPVSLVDIHPTILETVGATPHADDSDLPGRSLARIAGHDDGERVVFAEYHAVGAITGVFMIRNGRWKYVHYVGYPPQLFDLEADPEERRDLGADPAHAATVAECHARLMEICDPEAVSREAFARQKQTIDLHGGAEAVVKAVDFGYTPAPGDEARIKAATAGLEGKG